MLSVASKVLRLRGGMAKKGVKKVSKHEKLAVMRAKVAYKTQFVQEHNAALIQQIAAPGYIANAVSHMSLDQVTALEAVANQQVRNDRVPKASYDLLVPALVQMRNTKDELETVIDAIEEAVETTFVEDYFNNGLDLDDYMTLLGNSIERLKELQVEQEVQRRMAALSAPPDAMQQG